MKNYEFPQQESWPEICKRPTFDSSQLEGQVKVIMNGVKANGDHALFDFSRKFDRVSVSNLALHLSGLEFEIDQDLTEAIEAAAQNIQKFHESQREESRIIETTPGVNCWRKSVAIQNR